MLYRHGRVLGVPHIVARADSDSELGLGEVVHGVRGGLELAPVGAVRGGLHGVVLLDPGMEEAEFVLRGAR